MSHPMLRFTAARYVLQIATSEELVDAADRALTDSVYSYSLGELYCIRNPTRAVVNPLFCNALDELGIPFPMREEALDTVVGYYASGIADGSIQPSKGVHALYDVHNALPEMHSKLERSSPADLWSLACRYYAYEDDYAYVSALGPDPDDAGRQSLDRETIRLATEWCRSQWGAEFDPAWCTSTVIALGKEMFASGDFSAMPILADALEDAGCDNANILDHSRMHDLHVRRCWLVDLILRVSDRE